VTNTALRLLGTCSALILSPALGRAAEADALAITANIQARHVPFGAILDPIFTLTDSDQIAGYTRCGDSALWTGHYLAAEAFRYKVTQASDALNNVKAAIAALKGLADVTGTNLLARCMVVANSPYAAGISSEEAANGIYTNSSAGWIWSATPRATNTQELYLAWPWPTTWCPIRQSKAPSATWSPA